MTTEEKYADIIDMPRPELKHPRMDITNRAKIFAPFDALRGFDEKLAEVDREKAIDRSVTYSSMDLME